MKQYCTLVGGGGRNATRVLGLQRQYCFAEPIRKVLRDSKGHFFKSVLLCGFGSEAPGGNAAGQHGFVEAIMFSERGFGGEAPDIMCLSKKTRKRFLFIRAGYTSAHLYVGENPSQTPKFSPRRPTSLAAAFIYYFADPIRKVFAESRGAFFKKAATRQGNIGL